MIVVTGDLHTKLLLHGNSFIDGSTDKRVITNTGVAVSTAQSKFGDSSFYFDGSAYLTIPGYDFGTDDFTLDWWEYPTNANAGTRFTNVYCTAYATQAGGLLTHLHTTSSLQVYLSNKTGGANTSDWNVLAGNAVGNNIVNTWTHRAVVRSGSSLMFFKNGLLEHTYNIGTNRIGYSADRPWGIGNWASDLMATGYPYIGYMDEFRVSDIARWTESFTPPTEPYPDSKIEILPGGVISKEWALRRSMMMTRSGGAPISELPLGTLINVGTDGGAGTPNYEIADKDNLVSGGVVLVRKNIYSNSQFGSTAAYSNSTLDNFITTTIYNNMPPKLRGKMMDVSFKLYLFGSITRKMFALTYTMAGFGNNSGVVEGKALQLYTSNTSRIKTHQGEEFPWWLSSQYSSDRARYVFADGSIHSYKPSNTFGVVSAFVIPSDTLYDPTPNTNGSYNLIL
jgi:hypothetical protein